MTREELIKILNYDQHTGIFTWKVKSGSRSAGSVAGNVQVDKSGYKCIHIKIKGVSYKAHRLAFLIMQGFTPECVDHENCDGTDNRWLNLREASKQGNSYNRKKSCKNTSGFKGVSWYPRYNKWCARVCVDGKRITLGYFSDRNQAVDALNNLRKKLHKDFANNG